jgi:CubicO group peptidase (beta-lactamase class C family)
MKNLFLVMWAILLTTNVLAQSKSEIVAGDKGKKIDQYLQKAAQNGYAGSVLVAQKGNVILQKGYGLADQENKRVQTAQTFFSVGSITKQFTGAAILKLQMQGKLKVNDLISKYFPNVPSDKQGITLHHLLTHSAGFEGVMGGDYEFINAQDFVKLALNTPLLFTPGEKYEYSNVGYSLLGIIVEQVSGQGYEQYLYDNLFKPAGMEQTGYLRPKFNKNELAIGYLDGNRWGSALDHPWMEDGPSWHLRANGGVLSNVRDMYLWYKALQSEKVLNAEAKKQYFSPQMAENSEGSSHYAYGWVVQVLDNQRKLIWHNGGNRVYNAFMGFLPEEDLVIIVSSNRSGKISDRYAQQIDNILQGKFKALPENLTQQYSGIYQLASGAKINVSIDENSQLKAELADSEVVKLLLSNGKEEADICEKYNQKVKNFLTKLLTGDFSALAEARDAPLVEVEKRAKPFWDTQKQQLGEAQGVEILATVKRPQIYLTFAKINFAKQPLFMMYVWEGEVLAEARDMLVVDKVFDYQSDTEFFAPNNQKKISFEKDDKGKWTMLVKSEEKTTKATKIN